MVTWLRARYVTAPLVVVASSLLLGAAPPRPRTDERCAARKAAMKWAATNRLILPRTLKQFSAYSMVYRKAIYHELSQADRESLWREHLTSFLGAGSVLTTEQQATVRFVLSRLDSYVGSSAAGRAALKRDGLTPQRLKDQFGPTLARLIFSTLGPEEPLTLAIQAGSLRTIGERTTKSLPYCNCSIASDWCGNGHCGLSSTDCMPVDEGCGTLWCHECDGVCEL